MPRKTIEYYQKEIESRDRLIDYLQKDIKDLIIERQNILLKQNVVTKAEYDSLKKQFEDLQARYNLLKQVKEHKKHNERGAGRKRKDIDSQVVEMRDKGYTLKAISEELNVGIATVNRVVAKYHN